jgi:tetratricopeptide (TPR) repeat protein
MRELAALLLAAATTIFAAGQAPQATLAQASAALQAGEADKALGLIDSALQGAQASSAMAEAYNLKCRVLFTLDRFDDAASECQHAVTLDDGNSDYHLWLGRALGEKADRASFVNAYSLAKRARAEFERAVELNPRNAEALADLGEFDSSAPGVVGGGLDKAERVAGKLDKVDPARAHELRGRIAEQRKDYDLSEREFRQAIAASPHPAFQWMTLASFLRRRERWTEMDAAVHSGLAAAARDKHAAVALFNGASVLARSNRETQLAVKMLEDYLASPNKTEEAPAFVAYVRLARLKEQLGDKEAAQQDRAAAVALAHDYKQPQSHGH